jgi:hypothetical protein
MSSSLDLKGERGEDEEDEEGIEVKSGSRVCELDRKEVFDVIEAFTEKGIN